MTTPDPSRVALRHLAAGEYAPIGPKVVEGFRRRSGMRGVTSEHTNIGGRGRMRFFGPRAELRATRNHWERVCRIPVRTSLRLGGAVCSAAMACPLLNRTIASPIASSPKRAGTTGIPSHRY